MAIHIVPALACAAIIVVTGLMARELGGGRVARELGGAAALFTLDFMATWSLFSMDVLDQLWWALASLIPLRLLRREAPRLWLLVGLVVAIALLTKLTVLFFGLALVLALLVTPERRYLRTPWPWPAAGMPILPPAAFVHSCGAFPQVLVDRFGWESLTRTVEQVTAGLPPAQRAGLCAGQ